jgi:hypothetical protein
MARRLLGSLLGLALASGVLAADRPPQDLHYTGDHWTAWNPPVPPAGAQVHVVVSGDTLWDLAQQYLGNPYLWPQIWERNQYILDAHWIYPGDPIILGIEVAPVEEIVGEGAAGEGAGAPGEGEGAPGAGEGGGWPGAGTSSPQPLGFEDDIYCSGYIGELEESFPYRITGSEFQTLSPVLPGQRAGTVEGIYGTVGTVKYGLTIGDIVYVDGGRDAGLSPGALYTVVLPGAEVRHPATRELFGRLYEYQGRVRVLSVQTEAAIAEIVQACDPIRVGEGLLPFVPEPVPLGRRTPPRPVNDPPLAASLTAAPVILMARDGLVSIGQDHVVYIDRGEQDVTPGDLYTIYRMNREGFPPLPIGELAVLSVQRRTALAKVLESRSPIYAGDRLDPK